MSASPRQWAVALALVVTGLVSSCGGSDRSDSGTAAPEGATTQQAAATVVVKNFRYDPGQVSVRAGEVVAWKFDDGSGPHDVKGDGFHSPLITNSTWAHRFARAGRYDYYCTIHPFMKGTVEVR